MSHFGHDKCVYKCAKIHWLNMSLYFKINIRTYGFIYLLNNYINNAYTL